MADNIPNEHDDKEPIIVIQGLHKSFNDHHVLRGIDLTIPRGQITTIIGGSGSGKSVLVKHIIGLLRPDSGQILIEGKDTTKMSRKQFDQVRQKFGMLFQNAALFDSMTVEENVAFPLIEHTRLSRREVRKRVREKLEVLGLGGFEKLYPAELSGGMRKRVGLARAIVLNPQIIIYDEPSTGLDPIMTLNVDEMIKRAQEQFKVTSIVISHDMASTFRISDKIAMIHDGRIIETGTPEEFARSANPHVRAFLMASGMTLEKAADG